jgi:hypothetical protein
MMALMLYVCSENGRGSEAILNNNMGPSLDHSYNVASTALIVIYYPHIPNSNKDGPKEVLFVTLMDTINDTKLALNCPINWMF